MPTTDVAQQFRRTTASHISVLLFPTCQVRVVEIKGHLLLVSLSYPIGCGPRVREMKGPVHSYNPFRLYLSQVF